MKFRKIKAAMLLLAGAFAAYTPNVAFAGGGSTQFKIISVFSREIGTDFVTDTPVTSPAGCSQSNAVRILLSAANYQMITASLLTAFTSSKPVTVWVDHCDGDGTPIFIAATITQ